MRTIPRSRTRVGLVAFLAALAAAGGLVVTGQGPADADVNQVSGSAYAVSLDALGLTTIPPTPGGVAGSANEVSNSYDTGVQAAVPVDVPTVLHVGVLEAQSQGGNVTGLNHLGFAQSDARAADVTLGANIPPLVQPALKALVIRSECRSDGNGSTGLTELIGASAGGNPLVQTPTANTPLIIGDPLAPIATAILNEQTEVNIPGVSTQIVVTAVHITVLPGALAPGVGAIDIVLARSACAAQGPDVLIEPTTTTMAGATTTTTMAGATTTTTMGGGPTTTAGGGANNNNNTNNNNNSNSNSNQNTNTNTNTIVNDITNINVIRDSSDNDNGDGGNRSGPNGNGDAELAGGAGDGDPLQVADESESLGTLALTGSEARRVVTLALLALVLGGLLVLGSRGLVAGALATRRSNRRDRRRGKRGIL